MGELPGLLTLLLVGAVGLFVLLTALVVRGARRPRVRTAAYAVARGMACDPGELGLAFESWWVERPGGTRLPVWEIATGGAEAVDDELTAVFIHGWGQSRIDMLARLAPWDGLTRRCLLYDLRGHGEAEGGASDLGCGEEGDLLALLEQAGAGPVVLVGHSMGAVIALAAATDARARARVRGVVAYGAYADFHESLRGRLRRSDLPARPITDLALAWLALRGVRHEPIPPRAAALACPLFLVHGTEDEIAPFAHAETLAAAAPDATLYAVDGAGHRDAYRAAGAAHDAALRAFVRQGAGDAVGRGSQPAARVVACAERSEQQSGEEPRSR